MAETWTRGPALRPPPRPAKRTRTQPEIWKNPRGFPKARVRSMGEGSARWGWAGRPAPATVTAITMPSLRRLRQSTVYDSNRKISDINYRAIVSDVTSARSCDHRAGAHAEHTSWEQQQWQQQQRQQPPCLLCSSSSALFSTTLAETTGPNLGLARDGLAGPVLATQARGKISWPI